MIIKERYENWRSLKLRFDNFFNDYSYRNKWLFRGHTSAKWRLKTSIDRTNVDQKRNAEQAIINGFKRNMPHYKRTDIDLSNTFQIVSYLQHYGAPTRLLDVSTSPYVAAFFALENAEQDAAIYAFDQGLFQSYSINLIEKKSPADFEELVKRNGDVRDDPFFTEFFYNKQIPNVYTTQPYYLFDRLKTQSGGFLIQGSVQVDFESNLNALLKYGKLDNAVFKFILSPAMRLEALTDLRRMNISRETLFPGVEGFIPSLITTYETEMFINTPGVARGK